MAESRAARLCVLFDADNIAATHAEAILEEISGLGEASVRRVFGDWSSPRLTGWAGKIKALGLAADQQFANTRGKNASDIGLVISAMDFLHTGRFDAFVIVSSDSDFTSLASRIREHGVDVFGIGEKKTPLAFRNACKRFIYIENLGNGSHSPEPEDEPARPPLLPKEPPVPAPLAPEAKVAPAEDDAKQPPSKAVPIIKAAMKRIGGESEWYMLGQLGQFITLANPDFDSRTYGSAKLSDLLRKTGHFEVRPGKGNHLEVRAKSFS